MTGYVDDTILVGTGGTTIETVLAVSQTNEILQTIQIILACITFAVTIGYTVYKWYKRATSKDSKGGEKITKEEFGELLEDVKEEVDKHDRN